MAAEGTVALLSAEREERRVEVMLLRSDIARIERRERVVLEENHRLRVECAELRLQFGQPPAPSPLTPVLSGQTTVRSINDAFKVRLGGYAPTLPAADARKVRHG